MIQKVTRQMAGELYSFHDCLVTRIEAGDGKLVLFFAEGFLKAPEIPGGETGRVYGRVEFEDIDPDFCDITLLKADKKGKLSGKRIDLKKFLKKYEGASFEIREASYGFNTAKFEGELIKKDRVYSGQQLLLSVYYFGDMVYLIDDQQGTAPQTSGSTAPSEPAMKDAQNGKAGKPDKADKADKPDKADKSDKKEKSEKEEKGKKSGKKK